jgi:glycosyltransferase involved in cell wall biosynthesis
MRILFVAPRFHTNQYQMVKTLQEKKHEVFFHVASLGSTEDYSLLTPSRYHQSKVSLIIEKFFGQGGVNRPNYFPNPIHYWRIFKELKPEIVIIRNPYRYFSLIAAFFSLFTKTKIIFYTQEELFRFRSRKTRLKQSLTMLFFKAAWMSPIRGYEEAENKKLKYMYYVPLPIPTNKAGQSRKDFYSEEPKILMVGKYHQDRKNHLLLIKAIDILKEKYKFKVTIVGECTREQQLIKYNIIKDAVYNLGLSEIIDLKKNVPFSKMEELYSSHHIFVLPAYNEPYSISILEALGYGLPVICTDTCGTKFNIINGENGFVIKANSLDELTDAMATLISSKDKIRKMSEMSSDYVQNNLSGSSFYGSFLHLINDRFHLQYLE